MTNNSIGNYHILSEIASGSFGRVYLAQHAILANRTVALKLMHNTPLQTSEEHARFLQEAQILEVLHHPYILPILDVGIYEGLPYIVSEYATQGSLREYMRKHGSNPLPTEVALHILWQIGQALDYAHEQHIIHRDLKPENILFNDRGEALLADFGLAASLSTASVKFTSSSGTPRYMAPEQFQGFVSRESDQYALGCIAYELFTGQPIFNASDAMTLMYKHGMEFPTPPSHHNPTLAPHIEQAILKALAKQRHERHTSIKAFVLALYAYTDTCSSASSIEGVTRGYSVAIEEGTSPVLAAQRFYNGADVEAHPQVAYMQVPVTPFPPMLEDMPASRDYRTSRQSNPISNFMPMALRTPIPTTLTNPVMRADEQPYKAMNTPYPISAKEFASQHSHKRSSSRRRLSIILTGVLLCVLILGGSVYAFTANRKNTSTQPTPQASFSKGTTGGSTSTTTVVTGTATHNGIAAPSGSGATSTASVIITPINKSLKNAYTLSGVTGTPAQNQLKATLLSSTQSQSETVNATGQRTTPATSATGTITIFNTNATAQVIPAGTTIPVPNTTMLVVLDADATPAAIDSTTNPPTPGASTVAAHVLPAGVSGDIAALTFNNTICCGNINLNLYATNAAAFLQGQDATSYTYVQQSDIDGAANPLIASLTQSIQTQVQSQITAPNTAVSSTQCTTNSESANPPVNTQTANTTVSVSVTCRNEMYNPQDAQSIATTLFQHDNNAYTLSGTPVAQITQVSISNAQQGTLSLHVQVSATGHAQISNTREQQLLQLIVGKSQQDAQAILLQQIGSIASVTVTLTNGKSTLPTDPTKITMIVTN